jgi:hypothetical protein
VYFKGEGRWAPVDCDRSHAKARYVRIAPIDFGTSNQHDHGSGVVGNDATGSRQGGVACIAMDALA